MNTRRNTRRYKQKRPKQSRGGAQNTKKQLYREEFTEEKKKIN